MINKEIYLTEEGIWYSGNFSSRTPCVCATDGEGPETSEYQCKAAEACFMDLSIMFFYLLRCHIWLRAWHGS